MANFGLVIFSYITFRWINSTYSSGSADAVGSASLAIFFDTIHQIIKFNPPIYSWILSFFLDEYFNLESTLTRDTYNKTRTPVAVADSIAPFGDRLGTDSSAN